MDTVDGLMVFSTARLADETAVSFCKKKKKKNPSLHTDIFPER